MIKENQKALNLINIVSDGIVIIVSMLIAYALRFNVFRGVIGHAPLLYYAIAAVIIAPFFLFLFALFGLYESFRTKRFQYELQQIIKAEFLGTIVLITLFFIFKSINISRWSLVFFFVVGTVGIALKRFILRKMLRYYRSLGRNLKHILLIGSGSGAQMFFSAVKDTPTLGFHISGQVCSGDSLETLPRFGGIADLEHVLNGRVFDEVVCALDAEETFYMKQVIQACEKSGTRLSIIPFYHEFMPSNPCFDEISGIPLLNLRRVPLDNSANAFTKRLFDIVGAITLIALTSWIMLIAAVGTKVSSPGPIIFRQERIGRDKKRFTMLKFRSMRVNKLANTAWSRSEDDRKTRFGAFLRKFSIDELPQLFNVLAGDMSLVGPRPELPFFVEKFRETVPLYMVKHQVRPGITGWAQVNGLRGDTSIPERIKYDIFYIENWSLIFDIKILFLTAFRGFVNSEKLSADSGKGVHIGINGKS